MKRNLKLTISALAVMLVMALAVTVVSFSLAGNENNKGELVDEAVFVSAAGDTNTNIDNIIDNSYASGTDAKPVYKIVEIGSTDEPEGGTTFGKMILDKDDTADTADVYGDFEEFVINGNKSLALRDMNPDNIEYTYFNVNELKDEDEDNLAIVSNADLIYVSNDSSNPYRKPGTNGKDDDGNDFGEEIYNLLHTYVIGDYKPFIIDKIGEEADSDDTGEVNPDAPVISSRYSFAKLIAKVFDRSGKYYYTFKWPEGQSVDDFIAGKGDSDYLAINGDKKQQNWTTVTKMTDATAMDADPASKFQMAEFLIVSAGSKTMSNSLLAELDASKKITGLEDMSDVAVEGDVYDIQGTKVYNKVYNGKKIRPHYVRVNTVAVADLENLDLDKYDMIILEEDCVNDNSAIYNKLSAAMYGRVNIIYSHKLATEPSGSGSNGPAADNPADRQETNYSELFYMVATASGQKKYDNVMLTDSAEISIIANSESAATCKVIADLINASAFRGVGGQKDSSNKFTVLEIQPCYPIDLDLAASKGDYYTTPADVVKGKTKEELDPGTEYYAWELSKAKIAHALNLTVDQVTLVQMSAEQFASTKEDVLGKYDLVYIGGNTSAFKDPMDRSAYGRSTAGTATNASYFATQEALNSIPIYGMYSHNGDPVEANTAAFGNQGVPVGSPATNAIINGNRVSSFTLLNGNDISYAGLQKLKAYVNAGMPVLFSSEATNGYLTATTKVFNGTTFKSKSKNYMQNEIDPDSNMYKFMDYCDTLSKCDPEIAKDHKNIDWGFNVAKSTETDSDGGDLGITQTGYVKVFDEFEYDQFNTLLANSKERPKVTLTNAPATYNMYDKTSYINIKNTPINFAFNVSGTSNYTATLYVDDNGNSQFDDDGEDMVEQRFTTSSGTMTLYDYDLPEDFAGPLYWKLEIKDNKTKQTTSISRISYIAAEATEKQTVRILQIMPGVYTGSGSETNRSVDSVGETAEGANSLYFCTVCQQAYRRLEYNPSSDTGDGCLSYAAQYSGNYFDTKGGLTVQGSANTKYLGLHEHEFGIVKYDSSKVVYSDVDAKTIKTFEGVEAIGADDWTQNLASEVYDKFKFDLDIMVRSEFVVAADEARKASYDFSHITDPEELAAAKADATKVNPYDADTDDYAAYEKATVDEKLEMIKLMAKNDYETKQIEAQEDYIVLSEYLIKYFDDEDNNYTEFRKAFADYPYVEDLVNNLKAKENAYEDEKAEAFKNNIDYDKTYPQFRQDIISKADYEMSSLDAEIDLRNTLMDIRKAVGAESLLGMEITDALETRHYWNVYVHENGKYSDYWNSYGEKTFDAFQFHIDYARYIEFKDAEIIAHTDYKKYERYISGSDWIQENYDMVVIGASEDFADDDIYQSKATTTVPDSITLRISDYNCVSVLSNIVVQTTAKEVTMNFSVANSRDHNSTFSSTGTTVTKTGAKEAGYITFTGVVTNGANPAANEPLCFVAYHNGKAIGSAVAVTDDEGRYTVKVPNSVTIHETSLVDGAKVGAKNALLDLESYIVNNGNVFMFHDTVSRYSDHGSVNLTNLIRKHTGMNRYPTNVVNVDTSKLISEKEIEDKDDITEEELRNRLSSSNYVPYSTNEVYFMTDLSVAGGSTAAPDKYTKWFGELDTATDALPLSSIDGKFLSSNVYTDYTAVPQSDGGVHHGKYPYKYAEQDWGVAAFWMRNDTTYVQHKIDGSFGTDKASRTNEGIVTLYPFTLSDELNISATHAQAFAVDLEDSNLSVWYSLGGGNGDKRGSSVFAASPNDGMDGYFIYTYKNFNYCGAGHANVTGVFKDNNDERRLYINIICNSVKPSVKKPGIDVYDYESTKDQLLNKKFKPQDGTYYLHLVDDVNEYPEFSFRVRLDESATVSRVRMYYDLDCPEEITSNFTDAVNAYEPDDKANHPIILDWSGQQVGVNTLTYVYRYSRKDADDETISYIMNSTKDEDGDIIWDNEECIYDNAAGRTYIYINDERMPLPVFKLREEYFAPYGGKYTYIVIEVTDTNGKKSYQRIKIQLKDKLFNLT